MKMAKIALDTNIWIYLTKDTFHELWVKLKNEQEIGNLEIIVPDIILQEWDRNKSQTIKALTTTIKAEYNSALKLKEYLPKEEQSRLVEILSSYNDETTRIKMAKDKVQAIEYFMKSCTIVETTDEQKLYIANLAIAKLPPFQNNKNNFNDSLVIRNIAEYINNTFEVEPDLLYVSNNPNDFINKKTGDIYSELLKDLEHIRIKNVSELGEALKLAPEFIDSLDSWLEMQLDNEAMHQLDIMRGK